MVGLCRIEMHKKRSWLFLVMQNFIATSLPIVLLLGSDIVQNECNPLEALNKILLSTQSSVKRILEVQVSYILLTLLKMDYK